GEAGLERRDVVPGRRPHLLEQAGDLVGLLARSGPRIHLTPLVAASAESFTVSTAGAGSDALETARGFPRSGARVFPRVFPRRGRGCPGRQGLVASSWSG